MQMKRADNATRSGLAVSRVKATPGSFTRLLTSKVADDSRPAATLWVTESLDDVR